MPIDNLNKQNQNNSLRVCRNWIHKQTDTGKPLGTDTFGGLRRFRNLRGCLGLLHGGGGGRAEGSGSIVCQGLGAKKKRILESEEQMGACERNGFRKGKKKEEELEDEWEEKTRPSKIFGFCEEHCGYLNMAASAVALN